MLLSMLLSIHTNYISKQETNISKYNYKITYNHFTQINSKVAVRTFHNF